MSDTTDQLLLALATFFPAFREAKRTRKQDRMEEERHKSTMRAMDQQYLYTALQMQQAKIDAAKKLDQEMEAKAFLESAQKTPGADFSNSLITNPLIEAAVTGQSRRKADRLQMALGEQALNRGGVDLWQAQNEPVGENLAAMAQIRTDYYIQQGYAPSVAQAKGLADAQRIVAAGQASSYAGQRGQAGTPPPQGTGGTTPSVPQTGGGQGYGGESGVTVFDRNGLPGFGQPQGIGGAPNGAGGIPPPTQFDLEAAMQPQVAPPNGLFGVARHWLGGKFANTGKEVAYERNPNWLNPTEEEKANAIEYLQGNLIAAYQAAAQANPDDPKAIRAEVENAYDALRRTIGENFRAGEKNDLMPAEYEAAADQAYAMAGEMERAAAAEIFKENQAAVKEEIAFLESLAKANDLVGPTGDVVGVKDEALDKMIRAAMQDATRKGSPSFAGVEQAINEAMALGKGGENAPRIGSEKETKGRTGPLAEQWRNADTPEKQGALVRQTIENLLGFGVESAKNLPGAITEKSKSIGEFQRGLGIPWWLNTAEMLYQNSVKEPTGTEFYIPSLLPDATPDMSPALARALAERLSDRLKRNKAPWK